MARTHWPILVAACSICCGVGLFQLSQGAYASNLANDPDEAAHFVTGVCLLDYCRTALGANPVAFAESFYVRYPKVAFGHWPPMFYAVQAAWYALLGASTVSAILLMGLITATAAFVLFLRLQLLFGSAIAALSVAVLLCLPVVRETPLLVMSDMLASLFTLLAALAICDVIVSRRRRHWIAFAIWASMAVLTKESALILAALVPAALVLSADSVRLTRTMLRRIVLAAVLLGGALLLLYAARNLFYARPLPIDWTELWQRGSFLGPFFQDGSIALFCVALYGLIRGMPGRQDRAIHVKAAAVWLTATLAAQVFFRKWGVEPRYFLPAYFPVVILFAAGLDSIRCEIDRRSGKPIPGMLAAVLLASLCIVSTPHNLPHQRTGYDAIAASIPYDAGSPVILVSSDANGEGAMIVERLSQDKTRSGVVLRAGKVLASSDWMGGHYKLLLNSVPQIRAFLDAAAVRYIVLDMNGFINGVTRTHQRLLEEAILGDPDRFHPAGNFPLYFDGRRRDGAVQVYENVHAAGKRPGEIRIDMAQTLGRTLKIRLSERGNATEPMHVLWKPLRAWLMFRLPRHEPGSPAIEIAPPSDRFGPNGGWGRFYLTAPAGYSWRLTQSPDWIAILSGSIGTGDAVVGYKASANTSNEPRFAAIRAGESVFQVTQEPSLDVSLPFFEKFRVLPARWVTNASGRAWSTEPAILWTFEDQSSRPSRIFLAPGELDGNNALVIQKPEADKETWWTQLCLPRVPLQPGARYRLSVRLKAENPALVGLAFTQRTAPYRSCGLAQSIAVSTAWKEFTIPFSAAGEGCGPENNRISIEAGRVKGGLWIAAFSLVREPL